MPFPSGSHARLLVVVLSMSKTIVRISYTEGFLCCLQKVYVIIMENVTNSMKNIKKCVGGSILSRCDRNTNTINEHFRSYMNANQNFVKD